MRSRNLRKCLITLMAGGCMYATVSCVPNRDQINSMISSSLLSGISYAIQLGLQEALTGTTILDAGSTAVIETTEPTEEATDATQG